jgi:RHS repeat-associated protein
MFVFNLSYLRALSPIRRNRICNSGPNESPEDREVYFDDLSIAHIQTKPVIQKDDYYPFGLTFNSYTSGTENLYKYNSFEQQKETGWYEYMARYYDPALGRFLQVDPAADLMRRHSPYNYAFDNPIRYIDPDGMAPSEGDQCPDGDCDDSKPSPAQDALDKLNELKGDIIVQLNFIRDLWGSSTSETTEENKEENEEEEEPTTYETPDWMNGGYVISGPWVPGNGYNRNGKAEREFEAPNLPGLQYSKASLAKEVAGLIDAGMSIIKIKQYLEEKYHLEPGTAVIVGGQIAIRHADNVPFQAEYTFLLNDSTVLRKNSHHGGLNFYSTYHKQKDGTYVKIEE